MARQATQMKKQRTHYSDAYREEALSFAIGSLKRVGQDSVMTGPHYWLALRQSSDANFEAMQPAGWLLSRGGGRKRPVKY